MPSAAKVGLLVVVAVGLLAAAYLVLGRGIFSQATTAYFVDLDDARGISDGATVLLAGVAVGRVESVGLTPDQRARVELAIRSAVSLPEGTVASVESSLVGIGDRRLLLHASASGAALPPRAVIPGVTKSPFADLFPGSQETMTELRATLKAARAILEDDGLKRGIEEMLAAGKETAANFALVARRIDRLVAGSQAELARALQTGNRVLDSVARTARTAETSLANLKLDETTQRLSAELEATLIEGRKLVKDMSAFINDPDLRQNLDAISTNTRQMSESGLKIAANAEEITRNGITLSEKAIELADKASALADDLRDAIDRFKGGLGGLPKGALRLGVEGSVARETRPGRWRTDIELTYPYENRIVHFGLYDALESNKVNLQLGQEIAPGLRARYGVYASKAGGGLDLELGPHLQLRSDLFNPNEPRFDVKLRYVPTGSIFGWVGVDDIGGRNAPTIGLGVRR